MRDKVMTHKIKRKIKRINYNYDLLEQNLSQATRKEFETYLKDVEKFIKNSSRFTHVKDILGNSIAFNVFFSDAINAICGNIKNEKTWNDYKESYNPAYTLIERNFNHYNFDKYNVGEVKIGKSVLSYIFAQDFDIKKLNELATLSWRHITGFKNQDVVLIQKG
jgi:hypothetical protein